MTTKGHAVITLLCILILLIVALVCYYLTREWINPMIQYDSIKYECNCSILFAGVNNSTQNLTNLIPLH